MKTSILKTFCLATLMLAAQSVCGQRRAWQQTELKQWNFSKNKTEWQQVSIPHSCNAMDGHSQSYYRGKAYYKKQIEFSKSDLKKPAYILFEGAAQAATVSVNGKQVIEHRGGYTPFVVSLDKFIHEGKFGFQQKQWSPQPRIPVEDEHSFVSARKIRLVSHACKHTVCKPRKSHGKS